jgi:hypothetical protein
MNYREDRPLTDPDIAARKIVEIANSLEPYMDSRLLIELINGPFLFQLRGTPAGVQAGLDRAIANLRRLPLSMRKANLQRPIPVPRWHLRFRFQQGEIGPDLFRAACNMGLEGLVSKRADRPYRGGRSKDWIKVKNRQHHAFERVKKSFA